MECTVLGWDDVSFRLDHRAFAYAGKFVLPSGKAAALEPDAPPLDSQPGPREGYAKGILGAASFSADRTDPTVLRLRYISVRADRRGEGIGPRLVAFLADRAGEQGYSTTTIAVNNPFAYDAVYKAGFAYTGTQTGIAELVCSRPAGPLAGSETRERSGSGVAAYREGIAVYRERDLTPTETSFCERASERGPPPIIDVLP